MSASQVPASIANMAFAESAVSTTGAGAVTACGIAGAAIINARANKVLCIAFSNRRIGHGKAFRSGNGHTEAPPLVEKTANSAIWRRWRTQHENDGHSS